MTQQPIKLTDEVCIVIAHHVAMGGSVDLANDVLAAIRTLRDRAREVVNSGRPIPWDINGTQDLVSREKLDALRELLPEAKP